MAFQPCPKQAYINLLSKLLPESYFKTILESSSSDIFYAIADIAEKFDAVANRNQQAYFIKPHSTATDIHAQSAVKASATIEIKRPYSVDSITIPQGTILEGYNVNSYGEKTFLGNYITKESITFASGETSKTVIAEAEFYGYSYNTYDKINLEFKPIGRKTIENYTFELEFGSLTDYLLIKPLSLSNGKNELINDIGRYFRCVTLTGLPVNGVLKISQVISDSGFALVESIPQTIGQAGLVVNIEIQEWVDLGFTIEPVKFTGGIDGTLDAIAFERGITRFEGETDAQLANRITEIAEKITVGAVKKVCDSVLKPLNINYYITEPFDLVVTGFILDKHPLNFGSIFEIVNLGNDYIGQRSILMDEYARFFIVFVKVGSGAVYLNTINQLYLRLKETAASGIKFYIIQDPSL